MFAESTQVCTWRVFVPELQGQSWWEKPVPDSSNLSRVSPDQLDNRHVSQVQTTLSMLFPQKQIHKLDSPGNNSYAGGIKMSTTQTTQDINLS